MMRSQMQQSDSSTYCNPSRGPTHGSGHDLYIHSNMSQIYSSLTSWGFDSKRKPLVSPHATSVKLTSVETFKVVIGTDPPRGPKPWLCLSSDRSDLLKQIDDIQKRFAFRINIYFQGNTGVGKSSFINSLDTVAQGYFPQIARVGTGTGSLTTKLRSYLIFDKVQLFDSMGMNGSEGAFNKGLNDLIWDGYVKSGAILTEKITPKPKFYRPNPGERDKMHVIVGVLPCTESSNKAALSRMKLLRQQLIEDPDRDLFLPEFIRFFIVLTAPELYDTMVRKKGVSYIACSEKLKQLREKVASEVGVAIANVFPVSNYTKETETEPEREVIILLALKRILDEGSVYFRQLPERVVKN